MKTSDGRLDRDKLALFMSLPFYRQHRIGRDLGMLNVPEDRDERAVAVFEYAKACGFEKQLIDLIYREVARFTTNA